MLIQTQQIQELLADVTDVTEASTIESDSDDEIAFEQQQQAYYEYWDYLHLGDSKY